MFAIANYVIGKHVVENVTGKKEDEERKVLLKQFKM
jgi:hypothetical protein